MNSILLLEDDESVNRGIEFTLKKEGYQVYTARTLQEARVVLQNYSPQMAICDINLPDGNGLELIRTIRAKSRMHIICLTALDQEMDQVMGYEAGADDYITKPFSLSVLGLKVGAFFKKNKKEKMDCLETGELLIDLPKMKVYKEEQEISLTKNEWKMLRLFLEHPRQILSKTQLLEQLFDSEGDFVDENTLAVNIRRLREKIEKDIGKPEYIRNIRGLGYIWDKSCHRR